MYNIFNKQISKAKYYENGAIGSFFFSANKYHWYHAPVDGTIVYHQRIEGIIYAIDKLNQNKYNELNATGSELLDNWIKYGGRGLTFTQGYLAHVATRCIIEFQSESVSVIKRIKICTIYTKLIFSKGHKIAMVLIGMTEISSCVFESDIVDGKQIKKGHPLGHFQFGGSSGIIIIPAVLASPNIWDGIASQFNVSSNMINPPF